MTAPRSGMSAAVAGADKKKRKHDVADTARQPDGNEKKNKNERIRDGAGDRPRCKYVEKRGPCAQKDMTRVGKFCAGREIGQGYSRECHRVDNVPLLYETHMRVSVRH